MEKWEEKLPPRARERLSKIKITPEDRQRIKSLEELRSLLSKFYQGKLDPEDVAQEFKKQKAEKKEFLIKQAQSRLIDSLSLQIPSPDFKRRGKCVLVLERLKSQGRHASVKAEINAVGSLIKRYKEEKNKLFGQLKKQMESNPELRVKQVRTEKGEALVQLSPDEAVLSSPQWKDFISRHEVTYRSQFARLVEKMKDIL